MIRNSVNYIKKENNSSLSIFLRFSFLSFLFCWSLVFCLWTIACLAQEQEHPLSYYEIIEQRNFFRPKEPPSIEKTEKLNSEKKNVPQQPSMITTDLVLTGTVKIRGNYRAIIEKKTQNKGFYVKTNDTVGDYIVKDIKEDRVILEKDDKVFTLKLTKTNSNAQYGRNITQEKDENKLKKKQGHSQNSKLKGRRNIIPTIRMGRGVNDEDNK
jgi:type II secretory pathway component PulC